jgi:hypothetical protein
MPDTRTLTALAFRSSIIFLDARDWCLSIGVAVISSSIGVAVCSSSLFGVGFVEARSLFLTQVLILSPPALTVLVIIDERGWLDLLEMYVNQLVTSVVSRKPMCASLWESLRSHLFQAQLSEARLFAARLSRARLPRDPMAGQ